MLSALHLLYEELKLDITNKPHLYDLATFLVLMFRLLGKHGAAHVDYYCKEYPELMWKYEPLAEDMKTSFEAFIDECC